MLAAAVASHRLTPRAVHEANAFSFGPVREVAFLFAGIFATMIPALGYLELHGREFGFTAPLQYYLASGALSSVLDNAPTYVNFLQLAQSTAAAAQPAASASATGRIMRPYILPDGAGMPPRAVARAFRCGWAAGPGFRGCGFGPGCSGRWSCTFSWWR